MRPLGLSCSLLLRAEQEFPMPTLFLCFFFFVVPTWELLGRNYMIPPFHSLPETKRKPLPFLTLHFLNTTFLSLLLLQQLFTYAFSSCPRNLAPTPSRTEPKQSRGEGRVVLVKGWKGWGYFFFCFFFLMRALQCIADGAVEGILGHDDLEGLGMESGEA